MSKRQRKNADADDTEWKGSSEEPESTPQTRSKRASPKKKQQKAERNEFDDDFDLSDDYEAPPKKKSSSTKKQLREQIQTRPEVPHRKNQF